MHEIRVVFLPLGESSPQHRIPTVVATGWMSLPLAFDKAHELMHGTDDLRGRVFIEGSTRASTANYHVPPHLNVQLEG